MKVSTCSDRPILVPCRLKDHDYQIDPYVGCEHSCYYCYALNQAETGWSKEVLIYKDIAGQLSGELENVSPQTIYMGYYSDPYQPCEAEYALAPGKANRLDVEPILTIRPLLFRSIGINT